MSDKPLERLNYFNGQRLEAADLRLEQDYHMRIQRCLSKGLFSPGVGDGLQVTIDDTDAHYVVVSPGLALDDLGRAIILVADKRLKIQAPYLCVRYAEQPGQPQNGACGVSNGSSTQKAEWGGPSRVISEPQFVWRRSYPINGVREIAIAKLEMKEADPCVALRVEEGPHEKAVATQLSAVYTYALEGARDLDAENPARIYFHIRGRQPKSVTLYLRAERFPTFHYTEMGKHNHDIDGEAEGNTKTWPASDVDAHLHQVPLPPPGPRPDGHLVTLEDDGPHKHEVRSRVTRFGNAPPNDTATGIVVSSTLPNDDPTKQNFWFPGNLPRPVFWSPSDPLTDVVGFEVKGGSHTHGVLGSVGDTKKRPDAGDEALRHTHQLSLGAVLPAGVNDPNPVYSARTGAPLAYVDRLQIWIGRGAVRQNRTADVLGYLDNVVKNGVGSQKWAGSQTLGNGGAGHVLVTEGTGAIRLDVLPGLSFTEGEYYIDLSLPAANQVGQPTPNGGRILYNLYIE